jgi:hypothetical protein
MLNTVKEIIYTVGDSTGSFAKTLGLNTADLARSVGHKSVKVAKDIGPQRALIGAAILAVAVGGSIILVRYLRRRDREELDEEMEGRPGDLGRTRRDSRIARAERRAVNMANANMR